MKLGSLELIIQLQFCNRKKFEQITIIVVFFSEAIDFYIFTNLT